MFIASEHSQVEKEQEAIEEEQWAIMENPYLKKRRQGDFWSGLSEGSRVPERCFGLRPQHDSSGRHGLMPSCPDRPDRSSLEFSI